jgi:hypothetical protein
LGVCNFPNDNYLLYSTLHIGKKKYTDTRKVKTRILLNQICLPTANVNISPPPTSFDISK